MIKQDPPGKAYQKRSKTIYARVYRGTMTYDSYAYWRRIAKLKLKQCRDGTITLEEFQKWLATDHINPR